MRKYILFIVLIAGYCININAQTYYNMWRGEGDSGKPEWIANFALRTTLTTGIDFTTANQCRGFVNGSGRWGFRKSGTPLDPLSFSNIINGISNLSVGVEGWACAEGLSVRKFWDGVTTTLDLLSADGKSSITSNGDAAQGLHIKSALGKKIYMYGTTYFNDKFWTTIGPGKNEDPTINNPNAKMFRIGSNAGIGFWGNGQVGANDTPNLWLLSDGNVRIGTMTTSYKLNVAGSIYSDNSGVKTLIGLDSDSSNLWFGTKSNNGLYLGTNNLSSMYIDADNYNNVYIGLTDTQVKAIRAGLKSKYKLFVNKGILAEDYSIAPKSSWSDFVFDADYQLKKIEELEAFVVKNKHLPDVPSAQNVAEDGYSQHDMNKILLQKIEELTLYTIQQQKEIAALKEKLNDRK